MARKIEWVDDWLWEQKDPVPPFCVDVVLRDRNVLHLQSAIEREEETGTGVLRVWDLRALSDADVDDLKRRLNDGAVETLDFAHPETIHPKLDWGNVYLRTADVAYCVEWHDRLWPAEIPEQLGFLPAGRRPRKRRADPGDR